MAERAIKLKDKSVSTYTGSSLDIVKKTFTDEIVFGICSPLGCSKKDVIATLTNTLKDNYGYGVHHIHISEFIQYRIDEGLDIDIDQSYSKHYTSINNKIIGGNQLREQYSKTYLAEWAVSRIYEHRLDENDIDPNSKPDPENLKSVRVCYIIDSLKTKEEISLLKTIYDQSFYLFGINTPLNERESNLREKGLNVIETKQLIQIDEHEESPFGQDVINTIVNSDFFIRSSIFEKKNLKYKVERFLHLIFESDIITPHPKESAMYSAKAASTNSACLSRQVGASITDDNFNILSVGWNDVPKFGGNLYTSNDVNDSRCKLHGKCYNDSEKRKLSTQITDDILEFEELKGIDISDKLYKTIKYRLKTLIEFSRSVHAEMHAIIVGAQSSGNKMINGSLFCTTYPCHNCARHIVASGIKEVYYIEPYKKSKCITLHEDSMTEDESRSDRVKILIYDGVGPDRYLEFFQKSVARKDADGNIKTYDKKSIYPKNRISLQALSTLEGRAISSYSQTTLS